jgi:hypothetical protein
MNLAGRLAFVEGGRVQLDGKALAEIAHGYDGKTVVLTLAECCGHPMSDGVCTLRPGHLADGRNHANLLTI